MPAAAPGTAHLPGGVWARVSTWAPETCLVEVGSIDADLAECKRLELSYEAAQAIRWSAWASQVWEHTPNEYLTPRSDLNMVNGTTAPMNGVFRGERASRAATRASNSSTSGTTSSYSLRILAKPGSGYTTTAR